MSINNNNLILNNSKSVIWNNKEVPKVEKYKEDNESIRKTNDNESNYHFSNNINNKKSTNAYNVNKGIFISNLADNDPKIDKKKNVIDKSIDNNISSTNNHLKIPALINNYVKSLDEIGDDEEKYNRIKNNANNVNNANVDAVNQEHKQNSKSQKEKNSIKSRKESSIFNFEYIDFSNLSYIKYLYHRLCCTKKLRVYNIIKKEIESLLDFYVYCNHLKYQYLLKDPFELKE